MSKKLLGFESERAFLITAPYGSGKSLASTFCLHAVENRSDARGVLLSLAKRTFGVDAEFSDQLTERAQDSEGSSGFALALPGHCECLGSALAHAARESLRRLNKKPGTYPIAAVDETTDFQVVLDALKQTVAKAKADRLVIYWDEFGRHLETLVSEGNTAALLDVQSLAEFVSRQKSRPAVLALFLHQGLMAYGQNLPQMVRREWKKIEGRFEIVDYVEDSKEIFRLLAEIVGSRNEEKPKPPAKAKINAAAKRLQDLGRWKAFKRAELKEILTKVWPLTPAALELLPKVSSRVSQNERTLFTFLYSVGLNEIVTPAHVYDFFSEQMRSDVEVGGTY
ncbi:hypothetical protein MK280_04040, partial [Myxococcota bacterium]|nr:hypothetical protein [Myxococcota bacterium]